MTVDPIHHTVPGIAVRRKQTQHVWIVAFSSVDDVGVEAMHVDSTVSFLLAVAVFYEFENGLIVGSDQKGIVYEAAVHRTLLHRQ